MCSFRHILAVSARRVLIGDQEAAAPIDLMRAARRDTLRDIVFLWTTPFCAERIMIGSAAVSACGLVAGSNGGLNAAYG